MMNLQYDNNKAYLHQNSYDSKDHRSYSNSYQNLNSYILDDHNTFNHHINNDTNNNNNNSSSINSEKIESNGSDHSQSYSDGLLVHKSNKNTTATAANNYNNNFNNNNNDNNNEDNNHKHKYDTSDTIHNYNNDDDEIPSSLSDEEESSIAVAIFEIGLKNSSPKILMPLMPHDSSLNTEHVKSHLQKYRIHRQRSRDEFHDFYHDFIKDDYYKWLRNRIYSSCSSYNDINNNHISSEVITSASANTTSNNDCVYPLLNGVLVPDVNLLYNNYIISNDNSNIVTTNMINYHYNQTVTPVGPLTSSSSSLSQINNKKRNRTNVNSDGDISDNNNNYHIENNITDNNHYYNSTDHNTVMNNYSTYIADDVNTMNQLHQFNSNIEHHHNNYITATVTNSTQMELLNDSEQVLKNWIVICNEIITNTETLKKNLEKTVAKVSKP
jgi:hypothetical protein